MEKTLKVFEEDLRDQIAQEIKSFKDKGDFAKGFPGTEEDVLDAVISIVKGSK